MSGGSYNYLYTKDAEDLLQYSYLEELKYMKEALEGYNANDAAVYTQEIINMLNNVNELLEQIDKKKSKIDQLWRAVEWKESSDAGQDYIDRELIKFRLKFK